jgi:DNA mismatch endonuclease (patch repair protein)
MPDVFTKEKRSEVMSHIRGKGNKDTELALARLMREQGIKGWRRHVPITGRPDFVFRTERVAVFVDGCFWHQCPKHSNTPANNREFWKKKLGANVERDRVVTSTLASKGWTVLRIWEHEFKTPALVVGRVRRAVDTERGRPTARPTAHANRRALGARGTRPGARARDGRPHTRIDDLSASHGRTQSRTRT